MLAATADFWASRASFDSSTGRYDIHHIVSVDEGLIGIGNDTYTNAIARKNLEFAVLASRRLGQAADPKWSRVAARLYIPYDSVGAYHPTYEGAGPETRGSVVPLLAYPLGLPMSERAKRNDLDAAIGLLLKQGSGAMMTTTLYPAIAAELGDRTLVDTLLPLSYRAADRVRLVRPAARRRGPTAGVPADAAVADHAAGAAKRRLTRPSLRRGGRGRFRPLGRAMTRARSSG